MHFDLSVITRVTIQINSELAAAAESNHGLGGKGDGLDVCVAYPTQFWFAFF